MAISPAGVAEVVQALTRAWNSGDSTSFSRHFAADGDVVNVYGMRMQGRAAIAGIYDMLFRSVFKRSRVDAELMTCRSVCTNAVMVQARLAVHVPSGTMKGDHDAVCSLLLQRQDSEWQIGSLHSTLVNEGAERSLVA